ncbi:MAG: tryptophan--tRNA ligase [bacterium]
MKRVFSGIQPSGELHIGNYFGAIKNWVELQKTHESFFCVVDLHAITVPYDTKKLQERIRQAVMLYLACGIDPKKSTIFIQSHIKEHAELAWLLNTVTQISKLERMTQFKDKKQQHAKNINAGLLNYPILQAADILLYNTDMVPVGEDQYQHIELARKIARKFNNQFGEVLKVPDDPKETHWDSNASHAAVKIMSLTEPSKKMSKSLGIKSYIGLLDDEKTVLSKIKSAVTGSEPNIAKSAGNLIGLYSMVNNYSRKDLENMKQVDDLKKYNGNFSQFKEDLAAKVSQLLKPIQDKYKELDKDSKFVDKVIADGTAKAQAEASATMAKVKQAMGL